MADQSRTTVERLLDQYQRYIDWLYGALSNLSPTERLELVTVSDEQIAELSADNPRMLDVVTMKRDLGKMLPDPTDEEHAAITNLHRLINPPVIATPRTTIIHLTAERLGYIRSQIVAARDAALKGNAKLAADICSSTLDGLARMKEQP